MSTCTKLCSAMFIALLSSLASAGETYRSVSEYIDFITKGASEEYSCKVSTHYVINNSCKIVATNTSVNQKDRAFGVVKNKADSTAFLFILKADAKQTLHLEAQSSPFPLPRDAWIEEVEASPNGNLNLQINSGHIASGDVNAYQFKLVKGEWRLSTLKRTSLGSCGDEIGVVSIYSANFLSGSTSRIHYKPENCRRHKESKIRAKYDVFPLSDFLPFDEKYENPNI